MMMISICCFRPTTADDATKQGDNVTKKMLELWVGTRMMNNRSPLEMHCDGA